MRIGKMTKTITFQYDEEKFEKMLLDSCLYETKEEYEKGEGEKFPTCEEFLSTLTLNEIVEYYENHLYRPHIYDSYIIDLWESEEDKFEKISELS